VESNIEALAEHLDSIIRVEGGKVYLLAPESDLEEIGEACLIATHGTIDIKTVGRAVLQTVISHFYARVRFNSIYASLKRSDKRVLHYLDRLRRSGDGETCTASYPRIATACDVSERTAQNCISTLTQAGLIALVDRDFGNLDRSKRGNIYRLLFASKYLPYRPSFSGREGERSPTARTSNQRQPASAGDARRKRRAATT
jgi:predicted AAA+ superfamily ATPase